MLSHVLFDNQECKTLILKKKLSEEDDEEHVSLLHKCIFTVLTAHRQGGDVHIILGILCFLSIWLYNCPEAVCEFLAEGSNIQFVCFKSSCSFFQLVEQVNQSTGVHTLVQGIAAFILGLCHEFNDDSEPLFTKYPVNFVLTF